MGKTKAEKRTGSTPTAVPSVYSLQGEPKVALVRNQHIMEDVLL